MDTRHSPKQNSVLAAVDDAYFERLLPHLELVPLPFGWIVYQAGRAPRYAYFPTTSTVALLCGTENGATAEIAVCGNDGMVGVTVLMGQGISSNQAVVQCAGFGYRMEAGYLKSEFERQGALRALLMRYIQILMTQIGQTAVCNGLHTVEQRLCRWLLAATDRVSPVAKELVITQEHIANMLGVRREGITEAAGRLQTSGVISCGRRRITVLDRAALEAHSCECYASLKKELKRLAPKKSQSSTGDSSVAEEAAERRARHTGNSAWTNGGYAAI